MKVSNSPQITALGGMNVSIPSDDASISYHAPALLRASMDGQINTTYDRMYGINTMFLSYTYHHGKTGITLMPAVHFFDYGKIIETDAAGNVLGSLRPSDYVIQVSASRPYLEKWNFGVSAKYINSNYGSYRANGIAFDVGVVFNDSARSITAGVNAVNIGTQFRTYSGAGKEELPFDLQLGITKRLRHAPLSFSFTMRHLHRFDIIYDDPAFNEDLGAERAGIADKIFSHFILAAQAYPVKQVELSLGYNFLRRKELSVAGTSNGLTGFSIGAGALFRQFQFRYGRSFFQNNSSNNQVGISFRLKD